MINLEIHLHTIENKIRCPYEFNSIAEALAEALSVFVKEDAPKPSSDLDTTVVISFQYKKKETNEQEIKP